MGVEKLRIVKDGVIMKLKKMTLDEYKSAAAIAAGVMGLEALTFAPRKDFHIGKKSFHVQGLFLTLQKPIAEVAKKFYNDVMPKTASFLSDTVGKTGMEQRIRDSVVKFIYDDLAEFNAGALLKMAVDAIPTDQNAFTRSLGKFLNKTAKAEDGRKGLSENLASNIMSALKTLTDGTSASLLFSDSIMEPLQQGLAAILDTFMESSTGNSLMNGILGQVEKLQQFSAGGILNDLFGLDKQGMSDYIDKIFSEYAGDDMVNDLKEQKKGDAVYDKIMNMDYDAFVKDLKENHLSDLLNVALETAGLGVSLKALINKKKENKKDSK